MEKRNKRVDIAVALDTVRRRLVECVDTKAFDEEASGAGFGQNFDHTEDTYHPFSNTGTEVDLFVLPRPELKVQQRIAELREELHGEA